MDEVKSNNCTARRGRYDRAAESGTRASKLDDVEPCCGTSQDNTCTPSSHQSHVLWLQLL